LMTSRGLLFLFTSLSCIGTFARAQRPHEGLDRVLSAQAPLQADLLAVLDAAKLTRGATVLAKARVIWNNPTCHLQAGAIVIGHVIDLEQRSKQNKGSSVTIAFDHAECEGSVTPFSFTLFAIVAYPKIDEGAPMVSTADVYGRGGMIAGHGGVPMPGPTSLGLGSDMLARREETKDQTPATIESGQVVGLKRVRLRVGTGPDGASIVSSPKDDVRLEGATQLVLMPRAAVAPEPQLSIAEASSGPTSSPADTASPTHPPPSASDPAPVAPPVTASITPPEVDETDVCTASCSLVPDATALTPARASLSLSTTALGYVPHDRREYAAFDFESTLNFLDGQNLLFTYDPHKLRQRIPNGISSESVRTIRAVVLDPATLKVKRILDWQVQGEGQYLWRAGPGRFLVHLGPHLRLLGPDLAVIREIPLEGKLLFVSSSPSGDHIAVGTLHERHTRAMHDQLVETLGTQPEEDVDIQLFDQDLRVQFAIQQSSSLPPPVLSDAGEVRVNSSGLNRWLIREYNWNRTIRTIAKVTSQCRPDLATPLPNAIFIVGCNPSTSQNWYRMIRLDGHPILNSNGTSEDLERSSSSTDQANFAVRVVRANNAVSRGDTFYRQDLKEQQVSVYRASDGKRLFFTINPGISLAEQTFALSPNATQLAIVSDLTILIYPIAKLDP
jgi:hypothetical protein